MPKLEKVPTVSFRLSGPEYSEAQRIVQMAASHGALRKDSVNTLAKACLFTRINEWKKIESQQEAERFREGSIEGA